MNPISQKHSTVIDGVSVSLSFDVSKEAYERLLDNPEPCDRDLLISHLQNPLGVVAINQLHEVASKLALNLSVQSCKFLESRQAYASLSSEEPQNSKPFQMPVSQAAKIDKNLNEVASCALRVITSVQQTCSMHSEEKNASIQKKRDAFEQTEIYKKAVEIEKLAEEALRLIKPAEIL